MARDFRGIPFSTLPEPDAVDFTFRLRNMLSELDQWARDQSFAMGRITRGEVPDGSGDPISPAEVDLSEYFFLPGRSPGQIAHGGSASGLDLELHSNTSFDGSILLGSGSAFDELAELLGISTTTPAAKVHVMNTSTLSLPVADASMPVPWGLYNDFGPAPTTHWEALATDDDNAGFAARNGVGTFGVHVVMSPSIPAGQSSIDVIVKQRELGALSLLAQGFFVVYDNAGVAWTTPTIALETDLPTSWSTSTYTLTGNPQLVSNDVSLANHVQIIYSSGTNEPDYWAVSYLAVGQTSADLLRWDLDSSTESGRVDPTGHMGIGTGTDTLNPMLTVESDASATVVQKNKGFAAQSGNLLEFRNSSDTLLSRVKSDGTWDGPISSTSAVSVTDNVFSILDNATPSKVAQFQCSGISSSTTRTFTFPDVSGTLPTLENALTVSGAWNFDGGGAVYCPRMVVNSSGSIDGWGLALDDGTGFIGEIQTNAGLSADRLWRFPNTSGLVVIDGTSVAYNLDLQTSSLFRANTAGSGASFRDNTTSTKRLRMILSAAVGDNALAFVNTAARVYTFGDVSSGVTQLGIAASAAGTLGRSVLTGQNASIGATTLLTSTTVTAGLYRVSFYLKTTTAGDGGDTVLVTVAWNDGTAQTFVSGNLDAGTLNAYLQFDCVVRAAASTAITYTTTLTSPGAGTPVHTLDARLEFLG